MHIFQSIINKAQQGQVDSQMNDSNESELLIININHDDSSVIPELTNLMSLFILVNHKHKVQRVRFKQFPN